MPDFHEIPKFEDRWGFVHLEYGQLDCDAYALMFGNKAGQTRIPIDQCAMILLGPGTTVTHQAMKLIARNNCLLAWAGEHAVRFYAHGIGGTHSSHRLLRQASLYADEEQRLAVARRMFQKRFAQILEPESTLEQLRGMEGMRVRKIYRQMAEETGVPWKSRSYDQGNWDWADPLNRALSAANACLYGLCQAAILSVGYSPAIGFIHTGKMLSFVYDVADFYKTEMTIPLSFNMVAESEREVERRVRLACRDLFHQKRLMKRILVDIAEVMNAPDDIKESPGELEGRAVSLANRATSRSVFGEPE